MPKITTNGLTHCIIKTNNINDLVKLLGFDIFELIKGNENNAIYKMYCTKKSDEYNNLCQIFNDMWLDENSIDSFSERFVFIQDIINGMATYYTDEDEFNKIQKILKEENVNEDSIICFKCNEVLENMRYIDILEKLDFCEFFGHETICKIDIIEKDDIKIMMTYIDAESS